MADITALKNRIRAAIKQNGNQEITGPVLQTILLDISDVLNGVVGDETSAREVADGNLSETITTLQNLINTINANIGNGYVYAGIATPTSTPVTGKVFYVAITAGTYTNFGGQVLTQGINILKYNGSVWSSEQIIGIDNYPAHGSNYLPKSRGVFDALYDFSNIEILKNLLFKKADGGTFTSTTGIIDVNGVIHSEGLSNYKTWEYINSENTPVFVGYKDVLPTGINNDFANVALYKNGNLIAAKISTGNIVIQVRAGETLRISTTTDKIDAPFLVTPTIDYLLAKYYSPFTTYKAENPFNLYFDSVWKVDVTAGYIFLLSGGICQLTAGTINSSLSSDRDGQTLVLLIKLSDKSIVLTNLNNLYDTYLYTNDYRIIGYGNPSVSPFNFITSGNYRYNGNRVYTADDKPTYGSNNSVKSGGTFNAIYDFGNMGIQNNLLFKKIDGGTFNSTTGIIDINGVIHSEGMSGFQTWEYVNSSSFPVFVGYKDVLPTGINDDYANVALLKNGNLVASKICTGNIIVQVRAGETLRISTTTNKIDAPFLTSPTMDYLLAKYYSPFTTYKAENPFNLYFDSTWKVDVAAGHIFLISGGLCQLTAGTINSGLSNDRNGQTLVLLIKLSDKSIVLTNADKLYDTYLYTNDYRIIGYGNPSVSPFNFVTSGNYKYNGKRVFVINERDYDMKDAWYYHENSLSLNIQYGSGDITVSNNAGYIKITEKSVPSEWYQVAAATKIATANQDQDISDFYGLYYYLLFYISSKTFDLITARQLASIADSQVIIGRGRLGIDKFFSSFNILINGVEIGGNNVVNSSTKKILWIGTSIPAGSTYPVNSCKANRRECINKAIGASYIRLGSTVTPPTPPNNDLSLSKTIAEYEAQYRPLVTQGLMTEETLNLWKKRSYENVILPYLDDIDIIVFDHGYNDGGLINDEVQNPDWSSEDRTTFVGAFNYLMKEIFSRKPFMKIFISTYFQNLTNDKQASLQQIQNVILMQEKIAAHFGYPLLASYKYCDFGGYYVPVHPWTDEAKEYLDKVYTHLLSGLI